MFRPASVISSDLIALVWITGLVLALACAIFAIRHLSGQYKTVRLRRSLAATVIPDNAALCVKPVLTDAETRLLRSLEKAVDGTYLVWPQLPLWTFIDVRSSDARCRSRRRPQQPDQSQASGLHPGRPPHA